MRLILLFLCLFPYIGFGILSTDTQPWALMFSLLVIGINIYQLKFKFPKTFLFFFLTFIIAVFYFIYDVGDGYNNYGSGITSLTYYLSTPIIALAVYNIGIPKKLDKYVLLILLIWFFFALVQFVSPSVNALLVNMVRTTDGRGLTSLAPEPVWYARTILLILLMAVILNERKQLSNKYMMIIIVLSLIQIIALSLSGTIFFYLFVVIGLYVLLIFKNVKQKIILFITVAVLGSGVVWYGLNNFGDKRVFYLINVASENPEDLTKYGGFSMRVLNAPMSIKAGIFESQGLGKGIFPKDEHESYSFTFLSQKIYKEDGGSVNGGYVLFIYQIGIFGFIWIFGFIKSLYLKNGDDKTLKHFIVLSMVVILFLESSPNNPVAGYLLGLMMLNSSKKGSITRDKIL